MVDSIKEVYEKYKYMDPVLSDDPGEGFRSRVLFDLWKAIKQAAQPADGADAKEECGNCRYLSERGPNSTQDPAVAWRQCKYHRTWRRAIDLPCEDYDTLGRG